MSYLLTIIATVAACLLVNYYFPAVFAKLTRKAGKAVGKL